MTRSPSCLSKLSGAHSVARRRARPDAPERRAVRRLARCVSSISSGRGRRRNRGRRRCAENQPSPEREASRRCPRPLRREHRPTSAVSASRIPSCLALAIPRPPSARGRPSTSPTSLSSIRKGADRPTRGRSVDVDATRCVRHSSSASQSRRSARERRPAIESDRLGSSNAAIRIDCGHRPPLIEASRSPSSRCTPSAKTFISRGRRPRAGSRRA